MQTTQTLADPNGAAKQEADPRAEWLAQRRTGIGGSDIAAICGHDPYRTPADVYDEKLGLVEDRPPTPPMLRGTVLEPVAATLYAERTGRALRRQPMRRHPQYPWALGNVDRQILAGTAGVGETACLEIKAPGIRVFSRMKAHGMPEPYVLQLQWYLFVFGYEWGSFAAFNAERWELIHFDIPADPAIGNALLDIGQRFWHEHVLAGKRPEPLPPADLPKMPEVSGEVVTRDDPEWAEAVEMLAEAKELSASARDLEDAAKGRLKALMGGYGIAEGAGARIYFREMAGRRTFDKKALIASRPLNPILLREALYSQGVEQLAIDRAIKESALDLGNFEKEGKPFEEFRSYFLRPEAD